MDSEGKQYSSIIWPPDGDPSGKTHELPARGSQWWDLYRNLLGGADSRRIETLQQSSQEILSHLPDPMSWESNASPFKGLVVGAIQSGKTESMIGVSATALDQGYKIIIVLTGNNEDLRRQTALRFNTSLLGQSDRKVGIGNVFTMRDRRGPGPLGGYAPRYSVDATYNLALSGEIDKYLRRNEPVVVVVKKDVSNLEAAGAALRSANLGSNSGSLPILVIDDECDEGSVGASGPSNPVPEAIEQIWRSLSDRVRIAYVGYTATAAANLLQDIDNPLYPSEFIFLLRYPHEIDCDLSWEQPAFNARYTGGDIFYRRFGLEPAEDANFIIQNEMAADEAHSPRDNETLYEALISFFVSGAYRLALQEDRDFNNPANLPEPHCMLIQASQSKQDHILWRDAISDLLCGTYQGDKTVGFDAVKLQNRIDTEEDRWEKWFERFDKSRSRIRHDFRGIAIAPGIVTWSDVKGRLEEVFSNTRLKIVNSDDVVGTSLDFEEGWSTEGPVPRQDTYVIIIGGQRLSRGITIKGLCITYYSRESSAHKPYADVTLQLSRWFGYRGNHIEFCRLFITGSTHSTLLDIHENDQDYRFRLATIGKKYQTLEQARIALHESPSYRLTAKTGPQARRYRLNLSPHSVLFARAEVDDLAGLNEQWATSLVSEVRSHECKVIYSRGGEEIGLLSKNWKAEQIADILDGISLTNHNPDRDLFPNPEDFRDTDLNRPISRLLEPEKDPYVVAAYLRFWAKSERFETPIFNFVIPYGDCEDCDPFDFPLLDRAISLETNELREPWRDQTYVDGAIPYMDLPPTNMIDTTGLRANGCPGILALYLIHKDAIGYGSGTKRETHTPVFGIAIPGGGPSFQVVANYEINS